MFDRLARMALMIPGEAAIVATNDTWMRSIWRGLAFVSPKGILNNSTIIREYGDPQSLSFTSATFEKCSQSFPISECGNYR